MLWYRHFEWNFGSLAISTLDSPFSNFKIKNSGCFSESMMFIIHQIENNQWNIVNQKSGKTAVKLECGFIQVFHFAILLPGKYQNESHAFFQISLTIPKKLVSSHDLFFSPLAGTFCTFVIESTYSKGTVFDLRVFTIDPDETILFTFHRNHLLY